MREPDDLSSDAVRSDELSSGEVGTVALPRRSNDDQLPRPSLLHFATGTAFVLLAAVPALFAAWELRMYLGLAAYNMGGGIEFILVVAIGSFAIGSFQIAALFRRSNPAAIFCAIIQAMLGMCSLVPVIDLHFQRQQSVAFLAISILLFFGTVQNFRWHLRLCNASVTSTWMRRYQLSELAAMITGFCIAAAIIAPFFSR